MAREAAATFDVPDLRLLAYQERKPMLRIVRLPERAVDDAPVSLDRGHALDYCLRRDGWLAFRPNMDVWGVPAPMRGDPFLVARSAWWVAGRDPATLWIDRRGPEGEEDGRISLYDGVARNVRHEVSLPDGFSLAAEIDGGFVLSGRSGGLHRWNGTEAPEPVADGLIHAFASAGPVFAGHSADDYDSLALGNVMTGAVLPIPRPTGAIWDFMHTEFSPDGRRLAVGLDYSRQRTQENGPASFREMLAGASTGEGRPHGLAIIETDGSLRVVDGQYENFARPVWSNDGAWIVFNAPFEPRGLWLTSVTEAKLHRIAFEESSPVPLADVSDLLP